MIEAGSERFYLASFKDGKKHRGDLSPQNPYVETLQPPTTLRYNGIRRCALWEVARMRAGHRGGGLTNTS